MKNLVYSLLFIPLFVSAQQDISLDLPQGWSMFGYVSSETINIEDAFLDISDKVEIVKDEVGSAYLPSWEFNALGDLKFAEGYQIKMTEQVDNFQFFTVITADLDSILNAIQFDINQNELVSDASDSTLLSYIELLIYHIDSLENTLDVISMYFGCKDHDACNYNPNATMSDNSCTYADEGYYCNGDCIDTDGDGVCDLNEVEGCTDATACNYVLGATNEDGSCQYNEEYYNCYGICENDDDGDGVCDELEEGCIDENADNYNPQALNSSNCVYSGCMDNTAGNYNPMANQDDGSCILAEACPYPEYLEYNSTAASFNANLCNILAVYGCMDYLAFNYNSEANVNEGCEHIYGCMDGMADNYNYQATSDDNSCIISGCTDTQAGNFNSYANSDDGSCLIGGCVFELAENYNAEAGINDGSCIVYGCILDDFPNYNLWATVDDGSCDMSSTDVFGCTDSTGYNYNPLATINNGDCMMIHPGELMEGGIVFYVDETGQHGLVSATEDLNGTYEFGCAETYLPGAGDLSIGAGYENSLNIVDGCPDTNTAAYYAINSFINGYSDWYLPSANELYEMYNTIGNGGPEGNIGGFGFDGGYNYWSSTTSNPDYGGRFVAFNNGYTGGASRDTGYYKVRVIRSF